MEKIKTNWKFYTTSEGAWDAMLERIASASLSIDIEQYIFSKDSVGRKFIDALKIASKRGVKVRIFCDEVGSFDLYQSNIKTELARENIEIKFFNSVVPWSTNRESIWYFRDHRKLMLIDGKIGFTGGICLSEYMNNWRESHVEINGEVVDEMIHAFEVMWYKRYYHPRYYFSKKKDGLHLEKPEFRYITNSPLPRKRYMYKELIKALTKSKKYIYLTTPYFLPDHKLLKTIIESKKRGVEIKLLVPEHPNHLIVDIGARTYFTYLLSHGIQIFLYKKMIHGKTMVIDDIWSTIGSLNLDNVSLRYNFEANLVSTNSHFAAELKTQFEKDLTDANPLTFEDWKKRPLTNKILEWLVWPLRKLL